MVFNCVILAGACYQKLPNPLTGIIQKLPVVDGQDEGKLLLFLGIVLQLSDFPGAVSYTHLDVYKRQLLYPAGYEINYV